MVTCDLREQLVHRLPYYVHLGTLCQHHLYNAQRHVGGNSNEPTPRAVMINLGALLTRRTMWSSSSALVFGRRRLGSILCTTRGTSPVPNFSTSKWLRKSSSLDRSCMFMILVGRHCPLSDDELALAAVGAIWLVVGENDEEGGRVNRGREEMGERSRNILHYDRPDLLQRERWAAKPVAWPGDAETVASLELFAVEWLDVDSDDCALYRLQGFHRSTKGSGATKGREAVCGGQGGGGTRKRSFASTAVSEGSIDAEKTFGTKYHRSPGRRVQRPTRRGGQ